MLSYFKDESAQASIETVVLTVAALCVAIAVGWWVYNTIKGQVDKSSCGANDGPFCID